MSNQGMVVFSPNDPENASFSVLYFTCIVRNNGHIRASVNHREKGYSASWDFDIDLVYPDKSRWHFDNNLCEAAMGDLLLKKTAIGKDLVFTGIETADYHSDHHNFCAIYLPGESL